MKDKIRITVFTPTYNRAYIIENLYKSLVKQSCNNFEWLIVDDGSTDNTKDLVSKWIDEKKITIRYFSIENGGKHVAINYAVRIAKGLLFFIVDSDDILPNNSLEYIETIFDQYENHELGGVVGRKAYFNGKYVGSNENFDIIHSNPLEIRFKYKLAGDLAEVFKTEVLKMFPFPEFKNEKFCPEALIWNRIAQSYSFVYFDEVVYNCEYLEDGLTKKITRIRMQSPEASMLHYSELESYNIPFLEKIKANINYWRFSFNSKKTFSKKISKVNKFRSLIGFPIGILFYINDLRQ